jgi:hypothetical protein
MRADDDLFAQPSWCPPPIVGKDSDAHMRSTILRLSCIFLSSLLVFNSIAMASVGSKDTAYVGGTIENLKAGSEGKSSTEDKKVFVFESKGGTVRIPYDEVNDLEYGQKAGRRLGLALTISPWLLLSKKRKHFLTIGYTDSDGKQQAAVFELGKDIVRVTVASLEARTGKKVEYQDDEARKSGMGGP